VFLFFEEISLFSSSEASLKLEEDDDALFSMFNFSIIFLYFSVKTLSTSSTFFLFNEEYDTYDKTVSFSPFGLSMLSKLTFDYGLEGNNLAVGVCIIPSSNYLFFNASISSSR